MYKSERWTIGLTAVIALGGLIAAIVALLQLSDMRASARDTHDLAASAKTQAQQAVVSVAEMQKENATIRMIADAARQQSISSDSIAEADRKEAAANASTAKAARDSANVAARELEISERPWVDAAAAIDGPLTFDVNGARLPVVFALRNVGHSPAFGVTLSPTIILRSSNPDPNVIRNQGCTPRAITGAGPSLTLFPNETLPERFFLSISKEQIGEADRLAASAGLPKGQFFWPVMVSCIVYRSTFDSKSFYATSYIYNVQRIDESGNPRIDFDYGKPIEPAHLRLQIDAFGGIEAN